MADEHKEAADLMLRKLGKDVKVDSKAGDKDIEKRMRSLQNERYLTDEKRKRKATL